MAKEQVQDPASNLPMEAIKAIQDIVAKNSPILDTIEHDQQLERQFKQDSKKIFSVKQEVDNLLAYIVDQSPARREDRGRDTILLTQRVSPQWLRRAGRTETPRLIKNLRRLQLTQFAKPASRKEHGKEVGLALEWINPLYEATTKEKEELAALEVRLAEKFFFPAGEGQPSLVKFLGQCYEDWFDLDDITMEKVRDGLSGVTALQLHDPQMWRPTVNRVSAVPSRYDEDMIFDDSFTELEVEEARYDYILKMDEKKVLGATRDRIIKHHFFGQTDHRYWRTGYSVMEQAIGITTQILNAFTYNASNFTKNKTPQGLLALSGEGMNNQIIVEKFKKILWASMTGVGDKRRVPIVGLPAQGKAEWVGIQGNPKELEYYTGITLLTSMLYALSGTNPNESGLASFRDAIRTQTMNEDKLDGVYKQSKDTGLITFLSHVEDLLNTPDSEGRSVFQEISKLPIRSRFKGLATEDLKVKYELHTSRLKSTATINELRKEEQKPTVQYGIEVNGVDIADLPALESTGIGGIIRAQIQNEQQMKQQQELAEQQPQAGAAGAGGQAGAPDGNQPQELTDADQKLIEQYGEPA